MRLYVPSYSTSGRRSACGSPKTGQALTSEPRVPRERLPRARHTRSLSPHRLRMSRRQRRSTRFPAAVHVKLQIKRTRQLFIALLLFTARTRLLLFHSLHLSCSARALVLMMMPRCRGSRWLRLRTTTLGMGAVIVVVGAGWERKWSLVSVEEVRVW